MSDHTITVSASSGTIINALVTIPQQARMGSIANAMMRRVGLVIMKLIKEAYIAKSRGGYDAAGDKWRPLDPRTIAYSRRGRTRTEKKRESRPSQALNKKQNARWWDLYRQGLVIFKGNKGSAAKRAWTILKRSGARTIIAKYGGRKVEILRDTGVLLNSLSPHSSSGYRIFKIENGSVTIGTSVPYAKFHHFGTKRMAMRRLWPPVKNWPQAWWDDILVAMKQGITDITIELIRGAR